MAAITPTRPRFAAISARKARKLIVGATSFTRLEGNPTKGALVSFANNATTIADSLTLPPAATNFASHLNGAEEVPERLCPGQGQAVYQLSKDGLELKYRLIASNINNVVAAHIHVGPLGANGPVVLFLFGSPPVPPGGGAQNGVLGEGTATAANLVGPLTGQPLSALVTNMRSGNTYTNVHTNDGLPQQIQDVEIFRVERFAAR
jgi:hypothetical protein